MGDTAEHRHAREREYDAAALRIAERVRSSLALEDVLTQTLDELGLATGVSRSVIQLPPDDEGRARMLEWDRGDTSPLNVVPPTPVARRVFATGEAVVVEDAALLDDAELVSYLEEVGSTSVIACPVRWHDRIVAVLGFEDSKPRDWTDLGKLLERLDAQLAAAIAQAEVFEQQREALERLQDLNRMRDELVANVSHELRTPLTAIIGVTKTLLRQDLSLSGEKRRELLELLDQQAARLHLLARDLLDLARWRRGAQQLDREAVPFSSLVAQALQGVQTADGRTVTVRIEDDAEVTVDPHRMAQVLANLLENASRHGAGEITVRAFVDGGNAVFHVSDEGGGVSPEFAEEMFEPFVHDGDRTDSTGLGLSIARAIVESHGGSLVYLSPNGDRAHQFVVTVPAAARG